MAADLAEMESVPSENRNVKYLFCVIDFSTKYAAVKHLKDKKVKTILNYFIELVNKSKRKPNKLWVDQGREFYNKPVQEWLDNRDILICLTHNEGKSVIAERFIETSKLKSIQKWQLMIANLILLTWIN